MTEISVNRNYKDSLFRMLFKEKEQLLSLYNAVNGTIYTNVDDLAINTLENANINLGNNPELLEACQQLKEYAQYVDIVRKLAKNEPLAEAVEHAVDDCIRNGILSDFLKKNRAEAIDMSILEYDEEKHLKNERESRLAKLIQIILEDGDSKKVDRALTDSEYRERLYKEYHL